MDPLLEQLETINGYQINDNHTISSVAFADDLLLLATTKEDAQQLLLHTEKYLHSMGMKMAATKCTSFEIKKTKNSWYIADPELHLRDGAHFPFSAADSTLTHLGGHISPWRGLHKNMGTKLEGTLHRLRSAPLKPHQKLHLLTTFIIPHFLYANTLAVLPITAIRSMDSLIRVHVKDFLHLPASNPNGLLYCSKRDGDLGIPKLETLCVTTVLRQGITLLNTFDQTTHALESTKYEQRLERLAKSARIQWPITNFRQLDAYKKNQEEELRQWGALPSKGKSIPYFADDRYGNSWLYNPTLLKPCRFLTALSLRSETTSDRVCLNKVIPQATTKCRK